MSMNESIDFDHGVVELAHGAGGRAMEQLIDELFVAEFHNDMLAAKNDQACFTLPRGRTVMSTDSFVITPLFFPGGDIGSLAVHGTVNDLAVAGARPLYLSCGFILEEGFALADLRKIVASMARAAREVPVQIVTGDTKVVERGKGDGVFINTTGIGVIEDDRLDLAADRVRPGDKMIVSGYLGDHGIAVLSCREGFHFESSVVSDAATLYGLTAAMVKMTPQIRCMRDPTRGGLAAIAHEIARASHVSLRLYEERIPVRDEVLAVTEFLGLDPLYIANEGKVVAFVPPECADALVAAMREHPLGRHATVVGEALPRDPDAAVTLETALGSTRMLHYLRGEPLPRIC